MISYIGRRLVMMVGVVFAVMTLAFFMGALVPGDVAQIMAGIDASEEDIELIREKYALNKPLPIQYMRYLSRLIYADLGKSIRTKRPVFHEIIARYPATMELALISTLLSLLLALVLGSQAAIHFNSFLDTSTMMGALVGVSMPSFWRGLMLMLAFSLFLRWLPPSGRGVPYSLDWLRHILLPVITLTMSGTAYLTRLTRSSMLETLNEEYVKTARAKGLTELIVYYKHALRNALLPVATMAGIQFGHLLGGTVVIETVFAWPGMGRLMLKAILSKDFPIVQGTILFYAVSFVLVNLLVDLSYAILNPRIRYK